MCILTEARVCCRPFSRKPPAPRRAAGKVELFEGRVLRPSFFVPEERVRALCYTRRDGFIARDSHAPRRSASQETVSCGCHGARVPGFFCADEPHERALRRAHQSSISLDRKSTRLNSSHANISYAVFCLKHK